MISQNPLILEQRTVTLPKAMQKVVEKMYGRGPLDEVSLEEITYLSDSLKVKGYMATPTEPPPPEGYPVLIWNRGGFGERGSLDDLRATLILSSTAAWGYLVLATQYRGNRGGEGKEDWGDKDVNDALNLIEVAAQTKVANPDRIGIEGASRGGLTTYRALVRDDRFRCAVVHAGLSDLFALEEAKPQFAEWLESLFGHLTPDEKQVELTKRSAVYFADRLPRHCPMLLMHGDADAVVPPAQTEALVAELQKSGRPYEYHIIKGGGHVALKDDSYIEIDRLRRPFLEKYLKQ